MGCRVVETVLETESKEGDLGCGVPAAAPAPAAALVARGAAFLNPCDRVVLSVLPLCFALGV